MPAITPVGTKIPPKSHHVVSTKDKAGEGIWSGVSKGAVLLVVTSLFPEMPHWRKSTGSDHLDQPAPLYIQYGILCTPYTCTRVVYSRASCRGSHNRSGTAMIGPICRQSPTWGPTCKATITPRIACLNLLITLHCSVRSTLH